MKKVEICSRVTYWFTAEIPDDTTDFVVAADTVDSIYQDISKILTAAKVDYEGNIVSVWDINEDHLLYE